MITSYAPTRAPTGRPSDQEPELPRTADRNDPGNRRQEAGWLPSWPAEDRPAVLVLDANQARRRAVAQVVVRAGGTPLESDAGTPLSGPAPGTRAALVLIGLGDVAAPEAVGLEKIAAWKRLGVTVIAYAAGANEWPLRAKSRPLLAGAAHLLDSAPPRFLDELRELLDRTLQALAETRDEHARLHAWMREYGVVGASPALVAACRQAACFSQFSDLPLLICGASGTGKELLARAIAGMDPKRHGGPFVAINCAAVQPNLLESEFFGHRRGAFTGADRDRKGWIRSAEGGVLFLDEIGELDLGLQAKLLRVVQEGRVRAVGEEEEVAIRVRFLAATHQDLERLVAAGRFRQDLYQRLRALVVHLPPLRERTMDLPLLVDHFVHKHAGQDHSPGPIPQVSADFLDALRALDLPGNLRQLEHLISQSLLTRRLPGVLDLADLPPDMLSQLTHASPPPSGGTSQPPDLSPPAEPLSPDALIPGNLEHVLSGPDWTLQRVLRECERRVCAAALEKARGNQTEAARLLGITARSVYNKVRQHRLSVAP